MKKVAWKKIFTLWLRWSIPIVLIHTIILGLIYDSEFNAIPIASNPEHLYLSWYFGFKYPILNIIGLQIFLLSVIFLIMLCDGNNTWNVNLLVLYIIFGFISSIICFQFILIVLIILFALFLIALVFKRIFLALINGYS